MKIAGIRLSFAVLLFSIAAGIVFAQEPVLPFTVLDEKDQTYRDLEATDIQLRLGRNVVPVGSLTAKADMSVEVLIMIDASISQERSIDQSKKAANYLIEHLMQKGKDKVAVAAFSAR